MINPSANIGSSLPKISPESFGAGKTNSGGAKVDFQDTIKSAGKQISNVSEIQESANASIKELLAGKETDITSVVAAVAKADMSFKLLVGVRNKLIEAYKQTMNMQL
ncbi:MAG: flagellar hook-basal body complex protein FliE [Planctomycetota bacterium]|jgi:flagellar hook-basal body complex protein FliE